MLEVVINFSKNPSFHYSRVKIGHGFLSGLLLKFSDYDALLYIFVLRNYFCKYKSKKMFEKVKINMQTSSLHVLCPNVLSFLLGHFMTIFIQLIFQKFAR